jgi:hypothetical protein
MRMAALRPRQRNVGASWALAVVAGVVLFAGQSPAAQIGWYSATAQDGSDQPFISQLTAAGHSVTRFPAVAGNLTDDHINQLNAFDLVIIGRATGSGDFDDATDENNWNQRVTKKVMIMSAYLTRRNRLGWSTGDVVPDSGPTPLVTANPNHPVFAGVPFSGDGVTTQNNYNIQIDRGTTQMGSLPVSGANVIATHPVIANAVAIAEWPSGTTVFADGGSYSLPSSRYFFAGGSREADGAALQTAGQMDLTDDGQRMFVNFVNYALIPEPSACGLLVLAGALALRRARQG